MIQPLSGNQIREISVLLDQFIIGPFLDDRALIHHQYAVTVADCRQTVRYYDTGTVQLVQCLGYLFLCFIIKRAGSLVENQDLWLWRKKPYQSD